MLESLHSPQLTVDSFDSAKLKIFSEALLRNIVLMDLCCYYARLVSRVDIFIKNIRDRKKINRHVK